MDFGWLSLLPPLVAILLAVVTRRVILSLLLAVFVAVAMLQFPGDQSRSLAQRIVVDAPWSMVEEHLWYAITGGDSLNPFAAIASVVSLDFRGAGDSLSALATSDHLRVFYFTMLFGALVGVLHAGGAMRSLVRRLAGRVQSRRGGQMLIWLCGMLIFFDDYANTLMVGTTMRSTADRMGLSREKLAYLVDSTAAPVAGLALVSTWVATEISYMSEGLAALDTPQELTGFGLFLYSVPYRFYPIFALVLVVVVAWTGRDFGPMVAAESQAMSAAQGGSQTLQMRQHDAPAWTALLSIGAAIAAIVVVLIRTGGVDDPDVGLLNYWGQYIGNADPYNSLIWGGLVGLVVASVTTYCWGPGAVGPLVLGALGGIRQLLLAKVVLLLAWTLSRLTTAEFLNTQGYLGDSIHAANVAPAWIPSLVFVVAGAVAFATGTSWGTMGLLVPLSISVACASSGDPVILYATAGAVLSGAIFGDHCSPISDTTVLSSQASGCDHIAHVKTQVPYALLGAGVSVLLGSLPSGLGISPWWSLLGGAVVIFGVVCAIGKTPDASGLQDAA
ncbi:Na+/H+ antiporter NhaC family protein [Rosistilla oblonga]|uniref:Na+/H+ antiporter NhaC family protein n=1 Tax=Rosistilla oblonga TaxID=2527990 RepID=UPI003A96B4A8